MVYVWCEQAKVLLQCYSEHDLVSNQCQLPNDRKQTHTYTHTHTHTHTYIHTTHTHTQHTHTHTQLKFASKAILGLDWFYNGVPQTRRNISQPFTPFQFNVTTAGGKKKGEQDPFVLCCLDRDMYIYIDVCVCVLVCCCFGKKCIHTPYCLSFSQFCMNQTLTDSVCCVVSVPFVEKFVTRSFANQSHDLSSGFGSLDRLCLQKKHIFSD